MQDQSEIKLYLQVYMRYMYNIAWQVGTLTLTNIWLAYQKDKILTKDLGTPLLYNL